MTIYSEYKKVISYEWHDLKAPLNMKLHPNTGIYEFKILVNYDKKELEAICKQKFNQDYAWLYLDFKQVAERFYCNIIIDTSIFQSRAQPFKIPLPCSGQNNPIIMIIDWYPEDLEPINSELVIDLGNTRSYAIIIDDIEKKNEHDGGKIFELPLMRYDEQSTTYGIFDSFSALSVQRNITKDNAFARLSFTRLGEEAKALVTKENSPYFVSSPKRYFWDQDPAETPWLTKYFGKVNAIPLTASISSFYSKLLDAFEITDKSKDIPLAAFLPAMLVELLEQAELYLNSPYFMRKVYAKRPRIVKKITLTVPAAWSKTQIDCYYDVIMKGLDAYCVIRAMPVPKVDVSLDEPSAVILGYAYSEIIKYAATGENWVKTVGWTNNQQIQPLPPFVRIACIDIGGGTSDMVIAELEDRQLGSGCDLYMTKIFQDGVNVAGDEFLRKVISTIILPLMGECWFQNNKSIIWELMAYLQGLNDTNLTRRFWFPFALDFIQLVNDSDSLVDFEFKGELSARLSELEEIVKQWVDRKNYADFNSIGDHIQIPRKSFRKLKYIAGSVFGEIAKSFNTAISAFECDLVIIAGKTSESPLVKEVFSQNLSLPSDKFIPLINYFCGDWCELAKNGRIADAKITTVLGASVYARSQAKLGMEMRVSVESATGITERNNYWGNINSYNLKFRNSDALFSPEKNNTERQMHSGSIFLGRRLFHIEENDSVPAYEIRIKPLSLATHGMPLSAHLKLKKVVNPDDTVAIIIAETVGEFKDGSEFTKEDVEIRPRILLENSFWLDSGKIISTQDLAKLT